MMEKNKSTITEQILNLTLEILYLLTGEDYIIVKKPGGQTPKHNRLPVVEGICRTWGNVFLTPPHSVTQEDNEQKILDLTNKVIELLTGEVPIRCQDVALYFSMEEWEYIEGRKDVYQAAMMEEHRPHTPPDGLLCNTSPLHNVASHIGNEDDTAMDTDSETESVKTHNTQDVQKIFCETITEKISPYDEDLSDGDHPPHYSCIQIKEEPWDDEHLRNMSPHLAVQVHIKEEPDPYDGEDLTDPDIYTPTDHTHYPPIMEEAVPCDGQILTQQNMYMSTGPPQYPSIHDAEKPALCGRPLPDFKDCDRPPPDSKDCDRPPPDSKVCDIPLPDSKDCDRPPPDSKHCRPTDQTQQHPIPYIKEEPASSNKDLSYTKRLTRFVPIRMKKEPAQRVDHTLSKTQRYPLRRSVSSLVKHRDPVSRNGRKCKNPTTMDTDPPATSDDSGHPQRDDDTAASLVSDPSQTEEDAERSNSSSVYSVRQSADAMEILYHCPSCNKAFYSNLDLARHQVIHSVDKLFICSLCGKSFTEMSFLIKHQVIHTDLKLCVCQVCGGCFYSETSLAKHQKSHSMPVYCNTCGKCFFDKTEMEIHKRRHTGEKPFICQVCGKNFITKSVLNKHMLLHTAAEQGK